MDALKIKEIESAAVRGLGLPERIAFIAERFRLYYIHASKISIYGENGGNVYVLGKIPSSKNPDSPLLNEKTREYPTRLYYDVIFEFIPKRNINIDENTYLSDESTYRLKVYSNMPSFLYTFTYTYALKKSIADIALENKLVSKYAMKNAAKTTNPYNLTALDTSLYVMLKLLRNNGILGRYTVGNMINPQKCNFALTSGEFKAIIKNSIVSQIDKTIEIELLEIKNREMAAKNKANKKKTATLHRKPNKNMEYDWTPGIKELSRLKSESSRLRNGNFFTRIINYIRNEPMGHLFSLDKSYNNIVNSRKKTSSIPYKNVTMLRIVPENQKSSLI